MSDGPTIICIVLKVYIKIQFSYRGRNKKTKQNKTNDNEISNGLTSYIKQVSFLIIKSLT